ncbi:HTD2-containing [Ictidomys tridecemlineatus]|uniref:Uncharacterized protein n=1 Tax=Ictidomys tridecemlineatus TaxID=43179 RepID=A0A287D4F1_ICTTR|nr:HTD2-containing [Ictidomys tridecemlineatus]
MPALGTTYERIVYKNPSVYHYMKVCLEFQDHGVGLNAAQFKELLISTLKDLFGVVGAALSLDVLTYEEKTLLTGKKCVFRVIQVSPFLLVLSSNSRELVLD